MKQMIIAAFTYFAHFIGGMGSIIIAILALGLLEKMF